MHCRDTQHNIFRTSQNNNNHGWMEPIRSSRGRESSLCKFVRIIIIILLLLLIPDGTVDADADDDDDDYTMMKHYCLGSTIGFVSR